ncbi:MULTISPECIES: hypothetical protein [unclassified Nocardiopsis]|uniref:hypothetical protein n=1 Tax=unclassified Nocardiopsis TaxID=2649073 RepID=UPI001F2BA37C|nr:MULTISPECIES: hypothetical protein [unclassified Nocardiopsis]
MSDPRRARATATVSGPPGAFTARTPAARTAAAGVRALASLGAAALLLTLAPAPALAHGEWLRQDLAAADRVGLVLESGALRLDEESAGDTGVRTYRSPGAEPRYAGLAILPEQPLDAPTDTVDVRVRTDGRAEDVLTELRGVRSDGMWTEWHPTGEEGGRVALPRDVSRVQLRVEVDGNRTAVTGLYLRRLESSGGEPGGSGADAPEEGETAEPAAPFSARLFATRIGLVGSSTANGHRVRENDYFAALPSRRGLASRGEGEYTVRVCTTGALGPQGTGDTEGHRPRCAYLPVWDVGPWNIRDDHWNARRESWRDLDRGRPQAQAAYAEGHNGGLDGFGRRVRNPAGIDLADGAFRDGLRLPTNGWVRVDYLWTGEYLRHARIGTDSRYDPVTVRRGPGTQYAEVGLAAHSAHVDVACQTSGEQVRGPGGSANTWYRIGEEHYVPAVFAEGGADAPDCAEL